jgi:hypothetical protein
LLIEHGHPLASGSQLRSGSHSGGSCTHNGDIEVELGLRPHGWTFPLDVLTRIPGRTDSRHARSAHQMVFPSSSKRASQTVHSKQTPMLQ